MRLILRASINAVQIGSRPICHSLAAYLPRQFLWVYDRGGGLSHWLSTRKQTLQMLACIVVTAAFEHALL
ncbi:hypothetical protein A6J66_007525 [Yersinia enterocolitica]|nr:hypothetical protein A6J66_007525 [Yersinia enterocolitica]